MSALVRFQGKVIWIPTTFGEAPTMIEGTCDAEVGKESSLDMGNDDEPLVKTDEKKEECSSEIDVGSACSRGGESDTRRAVDSDLWLYRDRTVALLKRYARMAVESGRLPSLIGRECFGTRVTPYAMASFEDMAIFVHDMRAALNKLTHLQQQLITWNVLEEFSQYEIAQLLGCTRRWIEWQISDALDELTGVLVWRGIVRQEGRKNEAAVSDSIEGKNIC